jgi:hypothetical protein
MQSIVIGHSDKPFDNESLDSRFHCPGSMVWDDAGHCLWVFDKAEATCKETRDIARTVLRCVILSPVKSVLESLSQVPSLMTFPPGINPIMATYVDIGCGRVEQTSFNASLLHGNEQLVMDPNGRGVLIVNGDSGIIRYDIETKTESRLVPRIKPSPSILSATRTNTDLLLINVSWMGNSRIYEMNTITCKCNLLSDLTRIPRAIVTTTQGYVYWNIGNMITRQFYDRLKVMSREYVCSASSLMTMWYSVRLDGIFILSSHEIRFYDIYNKCSDVVTLDDPIDTNYINAIDRHPLIATYDDHFFFFSCNRLICNTVPIPTYTPKTSTPCSTKKQRVL